MNAFRDHDDFDAGDVDADDDAWDDGPDVDDDSDDEPTVPCPACGRAIFEDSPYCPSCEQYVSAADHAAASKPVWVIATALVCLGLALWWVVTAF
jgi:hypothetical protein